MRAHTSLAAQVALAVGVASVLAGVASAVPARSAPSVPPAATAAPASPGFASPTVVNEFVPGFEPDVAVDQSRTASRGTVYSSWPNGFSTTISYLDRSNDGGASFHPTEATAFGKPFTCVGGGDSELQVNRHDGQLLFADLQGLTNFSTSASSDEGKTFSTSCIGVKGAGVDRQWIAVDDNGGSSAIGSGATDGRAYLFYDNVEQNTDLNNLGGNQPVVNATTDGINYGGCLDAGATLCTGPAAVISKDDDIVGNAFVDDNPSSPRYHTVYEVRGSASSGKVLLSSCRGKPTGQPTTAAETAAYCTNPTDVSPGDLGHVDTHWTDHVVATLPTNVKEKSFVVGAIDSAGNVYVVWAQYPENPSTGAYTGTGAVEYAHSTDGGTSWSAAKRLNPSNEPTVIFPWITAGDPGRVAVVWYAAPQATYHGLYGPDPLEDGTWHVSVAQSLNGLAASPAFTLGQVSDHTVKYGDISTGGLGGTQDRSLGDFLQVSHGVRGELYVSYVDDTSGNRNNDITLGSGQTPPEAAGPTMNTHQIAGPSLYASVGNLGAAAPAVGRVTDPVGKGYPDAYLSLAGTDTNSSKALDLAAVSITRKDATHLSVSMSTADPQLSKDLAPDPTLGGAYANWLVRWAGRYGTSGNDGQIYYVGMQAGPDGTPQFYGGATTSVDSDRTKYFAYSTDNAVPGSIKGATITWTVPTSLVGHPKTSDRLYSVTGFTDTQLLPSQATITHVPSGGGVGDEASPVANLIDATPSFSYQLRVAARPANSHKPGSTKAGKTSASPPGSETNVSGLADTGLNLGIPLTAFGLLLIGLSLLYLRRWMPGDGKLTDRQ